MFTCTIIILHWKYLPLMHIIIMYVSLEHTWQYCRRLIIQSSWPTFLSFWLLLTFLFRSPRNLLYLSLPVPIENLQSKRIVRQSPLWHTCPHSQTHHCMYTHAHTYTHVQIDRHTKEICVKWGTIAGGTYYEEVRSWHYMGRHVHNYIHLYYHMVTQSWLTYRGLHNLSH